MSMRWTSFGDRLVCGFGHVLVMYCFVLVIAESKISTCAHTREWTHIAIWPRFAQIVQQVNRKRSMHLFQIFISGIHKGALRFVMSNAYI